MTVSTTISRKAYAGDGVTTVFPTTFEFFDDSDLIVLEINSAGVVTTKTLTTDYTVSGGEGSTGTVNMVTATASGVTLLILLNEDLDQTVDLTPGGVFLASAVEKALDKRAMVDKQHQDAIDRSIKQPKEESPLDMELPNASDRAGKYLTFGPTGKPSTSIGTGADSGLRTDLASTAASEGAELVGYTSGVSGSVARDVSEKLRENFSVKDVGAIGDGITNDSSAIDAASVSAAGRRISVPAGTYNIDIDITLSEDEVIIEGEGPQSILDMSGGGSLNIFSTITALPSLASDITAGDNDVVFASAHGLSVGDVFAAWNPTDYSFCAYRPYYRDGCMFKVAEVVSTTAVKVFGVSPSTFAVADVTMHKINGGKVVLRNLHIIPPASGIPIWIDAHQGVVLEDITVEDGAADTAIELYRCFDVSVTNVGGTVRNGDAYPVVFANCQKVRVDSRSLYSTRHCVAIGGRSGDASVPSRDIRIIGCSLYNNGTLGIGASDIHGGSENIEYIHCYANTSANMAGKNVKYSGCKIVGRPPDDYVDGNCIYGSETVGGTYVIEDCIFITYGNGQSIGSVLYLNVDRIEEDFHLIMRNNVVENRGASSSTARLVIIEVGDTTPTAFNVHIEIDGMSYKADAGFAVLGLAGTNDISSTLSVIVDNFYGPSMALVVASAASNYNAPMRLMRQQGVVDVECTSAATSAIAAPQTFRYSYPRIPSISVSLGSTDGVAKATFGGRNLTPLVYAVTTTTVRPGALTSAETAFSSTENVRLYWSAELREI